MKINLPALFFQLCFLLFSAAVTAQDGYVWNFDAAPYNSIPASATSSASYTLSPVGSGSITSGTTDNVSIGSCSRNLNTGAFTKPFGFRFSNNPVFIGNSYTIEMLFKFSEPGGYQRLLNFEDPNNTGLDIGIYIAGGALNFYEGFNLGSTVTGNIFPVNTYFQIDLVRNASTKIITCYKDGTQVATFYDGNDNFIPKASAGFGFNFFKDNADYSEESSGKVVKLAVYNSQLSSAQIQKNADLCSSGYFWYFNNQPFSPQTGMTGSLGLGSYQLQNIGPGTITANTNDNVVIGNCNGSFPVGGFTSPFGLKFTNNPVYISDTYTIEMVFTFFGPTWRNRRRLVNFESPSSAVESGFYTWGPLNIYYGSNNGNFYGPGFSDSVYSQVDLVRDGTTKLITLYKDGVNIGVFNDGGDAMMPHSYTNYEINFFKDCSGCGEESNGRVVKIGLFNHMLTADTILQNFNNICNTFYIVPVKLSAFNVEKRSGAALLSWQTASEQNNKGFYIERSGNGSDFTNIGFINGMGNSSIQHDYYFSDASPLPGKNFYRLRQIDADNRSTVSQVKRIDFNNSHDPVVYPNPFSDKIELSNISDNINYSIIDAQGKIIMHGLTTSGMINTEKLSKGIYLLRLNNGNKYWSIKLVKNQ